MRIENDNLTLSATDIGHYSACSYRALLDLEAAQGTIKRPHRNDPALELLQERGRIHERNYARVLEHRHGVAPFRVFEGISPKTDAEWRAATEKTVEAMTLGHPVLAQAPIAHNGWQGIADFLVRTSHQEGDSPSSLGAHHYEAVDAKLSHLARASAVLQLCVYSALISDLQGMAPEHLTVVSPSAGDSNEPIEHRFRCEEFGAYFRLIKQRMATFLRTAQRDELYPEPCEHCDVCDWWQLCDARRRADDHLSIVAGMGRAHRELLKNAGVPTVTQLAKLSLPMVNRPTRLPVDSLERLHHQASLQLDAKVSPPARVDLLPVAPEQGLARLPAPVLGDVFLDIEADRYALDGTFHYLIGWIEVRADGATKATQLWAQTRTEERANFEELMDRIVAVRIEHEVASVDRALDRPHVFHFAPFEKAAFTHLSQRFSTREKEVVALLRDDALVDLMPVVKQSLRAGVEGYSLKDLEQFYNFSRKTDVRQATHARRLFELDRERGDAQGLLNQRAIIGSYNLEDCYSTLGLRQWLERLRERQIADGNHVSRPTLAAIQPQKQETEWSARVADLRRRLLAGMPEAPEERSAEENGRQLLADIVDYHWREITPAYLDYHRIRKLSREELLDDAAAVGYLEDEEDLGRQPKGAVHHYRYRFRTQEYSIREGDKVWCPITQTHEEKGKPLSRVVSIDRGENLITVSRRPSSGTQAPVAFMKAIDQPPIVALQNALAEIADALSLDLATRTVTSEWDTGDAPKFLAARALLLRNPPTLAGGTPLQHPDEAPETALLRAALQLSGAVLPVQGPPGAGKTHWGARLVLKLLAAGKKVGLTAPSHKVVGNLLESIHEAAAADTVQSFQKVTEDDDLYLHPNNHRAKNAAEAATLLRKGEANLVAGTAWLWVDPQMRASVDVLIVDEAGQFSLANAIATSVATDSLVLLGDPQQLGQPSRGTHPPGASASALEHLLNGASTVATGHGIFLAKTWRLPPAITVFTSEHFYGGRLSAHDDCRHRRVQMGGTNPRFSGSGLWFEPVQHEGNVNYSDEEAERVVAIYRDLMSTGTTWTNRKQERFPLQMADILVVAPYNAQVQWIRTKLGAVKWTPSVGPKAGWRKRDACSDFVIIKNTL